MLIQYIRSLAVPAKKKYNQVILVTISAHFTRQQFIQFNLLFGCFCVFSFLMCFFFYCFSRFSVLFYFSLLRCSVQRTKTYFGYAPLNRFKSSTPDSLAGVFARFLDRFLARFLTKVFGPKLQFCSLYRGGKIQFCRFQTYFETYFGTKSFFTRNMF